MMLEASMLAEPPGSSPLPSRQRWLRNRRCWRSPSCSAWRPCRCRDPTRWSHPMQGHGGWRGRASAYRRSGCPDAGRRSRDRTDSSGVSRRTVVVRRQEAGVLDGDHRRRGGRALNTERTALQLKSTRVEHQVGGHRDGGVVEREGARRWVVVWREVGVGWVVDQLVAVQRWVVEDDRCWLKARSRCVPQV